MDHKRGVSHESIPILAGTLRDKVEDTIHSTRQFIRDHSPRPSVRKLGQNQDSESSSQTQVSDGHKESAFQTTDLPIIVSLEVLADEDQQEVMVQIMKEEWAGLLLTGPLDGCDPKFHAPRLEDLRRKILRVAICRNLGNLSIYTFSQHFKGFDNRTTKKPGHIFSVSESRIHELSTTNPYELFQHNKNFMMRAYPDGSRMVAMNWQNLDEGMMLNEGMFADEEGWVLKPKGYGALERETETYHDTVPRSKLDLKITILAGEKRDKTEGTIVECKQKTRTTESDHPDFGKSGYTFSFKGIYGTNQEFAFIRFKIEDDQSRVASREILSWACIRLDRLRCGYRFVSLMDPKGCPISDGKLLIKVEKTLR
ncbi:unnamed protein product [Parascedosporium putredinis]|uniref:PI-PLC Y-box domain-containing protein n=1 Tax=Parascedosporium putredinis TaxID=1442378 RepID=A0A9P1M680_9PEZI|nr:unnamed protein product [Parascedosporium putredinis]CAI7988105.1 unnamed protein product [Parascedosporium putredinis]